MRPDTRHGWAVGIRSEKQKGRAKQAPAAKVSHRAWADRGQWETQWGAAAD
jgi:hypothetical protein